MWCPGRRRALEGNHVDDGTAGLGDQHDGRVGQAVEREARLDDKVLDHREVRRHRIGGRSPAEPSVRSHSRAAGLGRGQVATACGHQSGEALATRRAAPSAGLAAAGKPGEAGVSGVALPLGDAVGGDQLRDLGCDHNGTPPARRA
jgi:hypothetical protein